MLLAFISSALAIALPAAAPEPAPVEIIVEGEDIVEFAEIQCENEHVGLTPICPHLNTTRDNGCIRCTYYLQSYLSNPSLTRSQTLRDSTLPELSPKLT